MNTGAEHAFLPSDGLEHPGRLLRDQAARDLVITRQTLHRILAWDAAITPETAPRLEQLCGVPPEFWLAYELGRVKQALAPVLRPIPSRALPQTIIETIGAGDGR